MSDTPISLASLMTPSKTVALDLKIPFLEWERLTAKGEESQNRGEKKSCLRHKLGRQGSEEECESKKSYQYCQLETVAQAALTAAAQVWTFNDAIDKTQWIYNKQRW